MRDTLCPSLFVVSATDRVGGRELGGGDCELRVPAGRLWLQTGRAYEAKGELLDGFRCATDAAVDAHA